MVSAQLKKTCAVCSIPIADGRRNYCGPICKRTAVRAREAVYRSSPEGRAARSLAKKSEKYLEYNRAYNRAYRKRPEIVAARRAESRIRKHHHRAFIRGATAEKFDPLEILERDGWRCGLCGRSTPKSKRGTYDSRAPELDHIIPISAGGAHVRANVQCACRTCNLAKGKKPRGQLRLVG